MLCYVVWNFASLDSFIILSQGKKRDPQFFSLLWFLLFTLFAEPATVAETKLNFLKAYRRPIPNVYNNVLQELIVQQHLMRYKRTYRYDPVFALGFVTVYDQLMEGYPSDEDREAIFQAYIKALKEDPEQYRFDYNVFFSSISDSCFCSLILICDKMMQQ